MPARFAVRVTPKARADAIEACDGSVLRVRVKALPADGKANEAVAALIARTLGVPRSAVAIVAGASARTKHIVIDGIEQADATARLAR